MVDNVDFRGGLPRHPELSRLSSDILADLFTYHPYWATDLGLHQWDDQMPDFAEKPRARYRSRIQAALGRLRHMDGDQLDLGDWADWTMLQQQLALLDNDERDWRPETRDPNLFNGIISASLLPLARRKFHTPQARAQSTVARLRQVPELLAQAQTLLANPPRLFIDMAIQQYTATLPMFETLLPQAFAQEDPGLGAMVAEAGNPARRAYERFIDFLQAELLPKASGDYRLGQARYEQRLRWQEGIDEPLDRLLMRGYDELQRLQSSFAQVATQLSPEGSVSRELSRLRQDHPQSGALLHSIREVLHELKTFCQDRQLVSIPSAPDPVVVETPAFMRLTTFASIDPPGPFEREATEAFYQVTLPDPDWPAGDQTAHLQGYNRWAARIISAHEVFPGHFVQFLHLPQGGSTVRKVLGSGAFIEGWAHYTEELVVDEGFGGPQDNARLRFMQLMEALERVGRFIVGIRLHCGDMSFEQAQDFFQRECYMEPVNARREALRGTSDPFYLIYTLGKLEILRMRQRAQQEWGSDWQLKTFHDRLLSHGFPTMPVLERLLFDGGPPRR